MAKRHARRRKGSNIKTPKVLDLEDKTPVSPTAIAQAADSGDGQPPITRLPPELLAHVLSLVLIKKDNQVQLYGAKSRRWRNELASLAADQKCYCAAGGPCYWPNLHVNDGPPDGRKIKQSKMLDTLLVSKDFYFAGVKAFYENHTLEFQTALEFTSFLDRTSTDRRRRIKEINISMTWEPQYVWDGN